MKRLRFIAVLVASGFSERDAIRVVDACDRIADLVASGLSPSIGVWLVKALANSVTTQQQGAST